MLDANGCSSSAYLMARTVRTRPAEVWASFLASSDSRRPSASKAFLPKVWFLEKAWMFSLKMQARPHAPARFARHLKKHPADITSSNAQRLSGESITCVTGVGFEDATLPWQKNQSGDWPVSTCFRYSHGTSWNIWWGQMGLSENSVPLHPMVNDHYPY